MICIGVLFVFQHVLNDFQNAAQNRVGLGFFALEKLENILAGVAVSCTVELKELLFRRGNFDAAGFSGRGSRPSDM